MWKKDHKTYIHVIHFASMCLSDAAVCMYLQKEYIFRGNNTH